MHIFLYRFLQLLWTNEAWLTTETNLTQAIESVCSAAESYKAGFCDKAVMNSTIKVSSHDSGYL